MKKISLFGLTFGRKGSCDSVTGGPIFANLVSNYPQDFKEKSHEAARLKARRFCVCGKICLGGPPRPPPPPPVQLGLKEKLPQAFMQIGWMEDDFRNLTAKVWANLDNPIKRYMIYQRFHWFCVCRPLRWHSSNICDVTTVQLSNGTLHKFSQNFTIHENVSSLFFYTWVC